MIKKFNFYYLFGNIYSLINLLSKMQFKAIYNILLHKTGYIYHVCGCIHHAHLHQQQNFNSNRSPHKF